MKAILCKQWGDPADLSYETVPDPQPGTGEVLIGVRAVGVNFADTLMIAGRYQLKPPLPFSPGFEVAGEVLACGEGVTHLKPGARVMGFLQYGAYAEKVVAPAHMVMPVPDMMDYKDAAAFAVAYGTSHVALEHRARLQTGETLLVHGASGGVGLTAVELGKRMGATVIATASTAEKLALCRRYGADHTINYRDEDFVPRVKDVTNGRGADVILDPVGGDVFERSLRCINWEGRILVIGFASGEIPQVPVNLTLVKNCAIVGVFWGAYGQKNPRVLMNSLQTLLRWYAEGKLEPHISEVYALEDAPQAMMDLMERRSTGKVVLEP